ncbi:homoserine dehydrogenase [Prochlorococcus sp. MIT 1223]|uniref:homoserine dehydrogenase n=1 Tax=Prochlorococcus sp. MIT 1223 TaxID=3096217 RepID=UPI002A755B67|nr:homoserine dehydrogenase [Prochlorococcus sp. MIT 1223]
MNKKIGIGLLGLGTVGTGVVKILQSPQGRNPLVSQLELIKISVRNKEKHRKTTINSTNLTEDPFEVVNDPLVNVIVEVMGGLEPARSLILEAISLGKSVVTANKAVIARHGEEIAEAANKAGVYVLIEAAVGGGIPIIEPLKQSLGGNKIRKVSGIINGTTNYILSQMSKDGSAYKDVLSEAQKLGYAESDPAADVEGFDAADKISILSGLAFGGPINRSEVPTKGINNLETRDLDYASRLGYSIKLLAIAENLSHQNVTKNLYDPAHLAAWVEPTLVPTEHPLAGVNGVNNAILIEGDPIGEVMFYGPGAGSGPTASAVVADILNIAGIKTMSTKDEPLDPLLQAASWRECHLVDSTRISQKNYVRLITEDSPGVIGRIGNLFGDNKVSIQSIVQFDASADGAEIVVITHKVNKGAMECSLSKIRELKEVKSLGAHLGCL